MFSFAPILSLGSNMCEDPHYIMLGYNIFWSNYTRASYWWWWLHSSLPLLGKRWQGQVRRRGGITIDGQLSLWEGNAFRDEAFTYMNDRWFSKDSSMHMRQLFHNLFYVVTEKPSFRSLNYRSGWSSWGRWRVVSNNLEAVGLLWND